MVGNIFGIQIDQKINLQLIQLKFPKEFGISAQVQNWPGPVRQASDIDQAAEFMRMRLCLTKAREVEVKEFISNQPHSEERKLATNWQEK